MGHFPMSAFAHGVSTQTGTPFRFAIGAGTASTQPFAEDQPSSGGRGCHRAGCGVRWRRHGMPLKPLGNVQMRGNVLVTEYKRDLKGFVVSECKCRLRTEHRVRVGTVSHTLGGRDAFISTTLCKSHTREKDHQPTHYQISSH